MVIRDLRIYAEVHDARVYHYRDSTNFKVDAILEYPDGRWAAFQIKLGFGAQDAAATNLLKLAQKVDQTRVGAPVALTVIFKRSEGSGATTWPHCRASAENERPLAFSNKARVADPFMDTLPNECRKRTVKYPAHWGGTRGEASWVHLLPLGY